MFFDDELTINVSKNSLNLTYPIIVFNWRLISIMKFIHLVYDMMYFTLYHIESTSHIAIHIELIKLNVLIRYILRLHIQILSLSDFYVGIVY